jgi:hypothetical protein
MRIIAVERIDKTYGRTEYDTYGFPDGTTDDEIATDELLCDAFEEFVNVIPTSVCRADGHTVDEYLDACELWFYDITEEAEEEIE